MNAPNPTTRLDALAGVVAELQRGQGELLRMYEELRELCPHDCLCAKHREQARREVLDMDVSRNSTEHEEYRPS
jgi:hypothetical protein